MPAVLVTAGPTVYAGLTVSSLAVGIATVSKLLTIDSLLTVLTIVNYALISISCSVVCICLMMTALVVMT